MQRRLMWRMIAPVLTVSLLLLTLGGTSAWYIERANSRISSELKRNQQHEADSDRLLFDVRDLRYHLEKYLSTSDSAHLDSAAVQIEDARAALRTVSENHFAESNETVQQIESAGRRIFSQLPSVVTAPDSRERVLEILKQLNEELLVPVQQLKEQNDATTRTHTDQNELLAKRVGTGLIVLGLSGAAAGLIAGYGIARSVTRSIEELGGHVRDIAGTLDSIEGEEVSHRSTDLPELPRAMRTIADRTTNMVEQLQETRQQAERSEQLAALGQLAAGLAHEIRNPLTSMKLLVQTAAEHDEGLTGRGLKVLDEEIVRLEQLLQSFLDFARPPKPQQAPTDVYELAQQVAKLAGPRAEAQDVAIRCVRGQGNLVVDADVPQLRQVVLNLLINAIDALPDGGAISVRVDREESEQASIVLRVEDDGPGLSDDLCERVFEPFFSTKEAGIGLGLAICKRIVESHGGTISAQNRFEGGAEFTVRIPAG